MHACYCYTLYYNECLFCHHVQFAAEDVDMILVANKTDMEESRKVKTAKGKQVMKITLQCS